MVLENIKNLKNGLNEKIIDNHKFFIYKNNNELKIYDSICPHQGAILHREEQGCELYCKVHLWRFDTSTGESPNIKNANPFTYKALIDENGDIHIDRQLAPTPPHLKENKYYNS